MKAFLLAAMALACTTLCIAQTDSTKKEKVDTIKVGGMIIIKKSDGKTDTGRGRTFTISRSHKKRNISTNWWIVDLGFANYNDQTAYGSAATQAFAPGSTDETFKLRNGKSINVNIWLLMQRVNLIKNVVNLKYGLGVELNNYRFDDERLRFQKNPTRIFIDPAQGVEKNKLAADYATVPAMLNFNLTPKRNKGYGFSVGVSAGYLYSSRQKIKIDDDKTKLRDDFDLKPWKLSYIGELNLGTLRFYGSYAMNNMWNKGLDQTPYNFGIRFSNW